MDRYKSNIRQLSEVNETSTALNRYTGRALAQSPRKKKSRARGKLFLKQCLASAIVILACVIINKSGFEFGKNCLSALGRAIRWEIDFASIWNTIMQWFGSVMSFFSDVL